MSVYANFPSAVRPLPPASSYTGFGAGEGARRFPSGNRSPFSRQPDARVGYATPSLARAKVTLLESDSSDLESGNEKRSSSDNVDDTVYTGRMPTRSSPPPISRLYNVPRFSRALSMPLPSQLGYLSHPHRSDFFSAPDEDDTCHVSSSSRVQELSIELADSVQAMIQTMIQISPLQLLDPTKEQWSACSLSVPTSSISGMLTSMKNLNYISANMSRLCADQLDPRDLDLEDFEDVSGSTLTDFDLGEMLQGVGDSLNGSAAQAGVDLVLYHGDEIDMGHIMARGDENGVSYALSHVIRKVLETTRCGDSIELGLLLWTTKSKSGQPIGDSRPPSRAERDGQFTCTIEILHKFGDELSPSISTNKRLKILDRSVLDRPKPMFSSVLLSRLLHHVGAKVISDSPPSDMAAGRTSFFTLPLRRGSSSLRSSPIVGHNVYEDPLFGDASPGRLVFFASRLNGINVRLHAKSNSSFARHVKRYLTKWGMEVTQLSPDEIDDEYPEYQPFSTLSTRSFADVQKRNSENKRRNPSDLLQPTFIFIDDDLDVLKEQLHALRSEKNVNRKRPSLASYHRPRSSPQIGRSMAPYPLLSSTVLVHFTSLTNYKTIKDIVHSIFAAHNTSAIPIPEIMVIPKPAGPRRLLTALYTAMMKPVVDPFFAPIATAPNSPPANDTGASFDMYRTPDKNSSPRSVSRTPRPPASRQSSDRPSVVARDFTNKQKQSLPLKMTIDSKDCFPKPGTVQLGPSPSSGLVLQSLDGQPAGIFFHPKQRSQRAPSTCSMEREVRQLQVPSTVVKENPGPQQRELTDSTAPKESGGPTSEAMLSYLQTMASPTIPSGNRSSRPAFTRWSSRPSAKDGQPQAGPSSRRSSFGTNAGRRGSGSVGREELNNGLTRRESKRRSIADGIAPSPSMSRREKAPNIGQPNRIAPPISVLIVDDNPINQNILSTFMKRKRIKYEVANNGEEAVQKFKTGGFHLILMDIQMPVKDGIQATKEIRMLEQSNAAAGYPPATPSPDGLSLPLQSPGSSTKPASSPFRSSVIILALTASSLQSDRVAALAAGCNDFLTKPVSLPWLDRKITEWGSIKALQMWADPPPGVSISNVQVVQARTVAERLHVPYGKAPGRRTPSPTSDVLVGGKQKGPTVNTKIAISTIGPLTVRGLQETPSPPPSPPSPKTFSELAKDLAQGGRRTMSHASVAPEPDLKGRKED